MAGEYNIQWTDDQSGTNPLKPRFVINPNEIDGPGNANAHTPLQLPGRYTVNYGEILAEDLIHILENFAAPTAPQNPTGGMLWFDTAVTDGSEDDKGVLKIRDKQNASWIPVGFGGGNGGASGGAGAAPSYPPMSGGATTDFEAEAGGNYFIETGTRAPTITLPAAPEIGDVVVFTDVAGTWHLNPLIVDGNGQKIMGLNETFENDVRYASFRLGFSGATHGWRIVA